MAEIKLKLKKQPQFPLEAEVIMPDNFAGKTAAQIKKLELFYGNEIVSLGDFFDVSGKSTDIKNTTIVIEGDLSNVKRIGEKMTDGEIIINGFNTTGVSGPTVFDLVELNFQGIALLLFS